MPVKPTLEERISNLESILLEEGEFIRCSECGLPKQVQLAGSFLRKMQCAHLKEL